MPTRTEATTPCHEDEPNVPLDFFHQPRPTPNEEPTYTLRKRGSGNTIGEHWNLEATRAWLDTHQDLLGVEFIDERDGLPACRIPLGVAACGCFRCNATLDALCRALDEAPEVGDPVLRYALACLADTPEPAAPRWAPLIEALVPTLAPTHAHLVRHALRALERISQTCGQEVWSLDDDHYPAPLTGTIDEMRAAAPTLHTRERYQAFLLGVAAGAPPLLVLVLRILASEPWADSHDAAVALEALAAALPPDGALLAHLAAEGMQRAATRRAMILDGAILAVGWDDDDVRRLVEAQHIPIGAVRLSQATFVNATPAAHRGWDECGEDVLAIRPDDGSVCHVDELPPVARR